MAAGTPIEPTIEARLTTRDNSMESRDHQESDDRPEVDAPPDRESTTGNGGPGEAPQVIETDDPIITSGPTPNPDWQGDPDQITVIETSRIRGPVEAINPNLVLVPVESAPPRDKPSGRTREEKAQNHEGEKGRNDEGKKDSHRNESGAQGKNQPGQTSQAPSLMRMLLYTGLVALVCGVAGAWGYSYFFGPSKSDDQKSSGKDSDSSKGSDAGKDSESSDQKSDRGELGQSQEAWMTAVKELHQVQEEAREARRSEEETKAVLNFLKNTLLAAGRPGGSTLEKAFWAGGQGKDVTLRKALDAAEAQVAKSFTEQPNAEASVREILGLAYLNLGDATQAIKEYERALELREASQGDTSTDTASCRNQLAIAYRLAGRPADAARQFDRNPDSPAEAAALATRGSMLLLAQKPAEAELRLRAALTIRQRVQPHAVTTFDTMSSLGEALLAQKKFDKAEPILSAAYEGLKKRADTNPNEDTSHLTKALERLVRLYEAWGREDEAMKWRKKLETMEPTRKAARSPDASP
jgi:tetratricopeptide (TPR) repeat protein